MQSIIRGEQIPRSVPDALLLALVHNDRRNTNSSRLALSLRANEWRQWPQESGPRASASRTTTKSTLLLETKIWTRATIFPSPIPPQIWAQHQLFHQTRIPPLSLPGDARKTRPIHDSFSACLRRPGCRSLGQQRRHQQIPSLAYRTAIC